MNNGDIRGIAPILPRGQERLLHGNSEPVPRANVRGADHLSPKPPRFGQSRTWTQAFRVARNQAGGGVYTANTVGIQIDTPDPRLLASVSLGFRQDGADTPTPASPFANHTVSADLYVRTDTGLWVLTNHVFDATQGFSTTFRAPWTYRWADTPGRLVATLTIPNAPGSGIAVNGDWWAIAAWGLAPGAIIGDDELPRLFAACNLAERTPAIVVTATGV